MNSALQRMDSAEQALRSGDRKGSWEIYHKVCIQLLSEESTDESSALFIKACLNLSQLGFALGGNFFEVTLYLSKALEKADQIGDRRSKALINLHLGRLYYFLQRRVEASDYFKKGAEEVEELGDEDILIRSAEFVGLYYLAQGLLKKASHYFEMGLESYEATRDEGLTHVLTPMWAGYTAAYMGEFSRAIGTIDYYRRFCIEKGESSSAATLRAVLGIILLMAKKNQEAYHHLTLAKQEAEACNNHLALYFHGGGLSYYLYDSGRLEEAFKLSETIMNRAAELGIQYQYSSPMFLEMFHGYYRHGRGQLPGVSFKDEIERILREPSIFMRGAALRLRALIRIEEEESFLAGKKDLEKSRDLLIESGASIQLSKTLIELARLSLIEEDREKAKNYANAASKELGGHTKEFYPDDLQHLIRSSKPVSKSRYAGKALLMKFMDVIQMLEPATDIEIILDRVVKAVNRLLGAERGGVIWFGDAKKSTPKLRASHNLTDSDLQAEAFRSNLVVIFEAYRTGQSRLIHREQRIGENWQHQCRSMLCIPITVREEILGVLYYDNSFIDNCFEMLDPKNLDEIAFQLSSFVERLSLIFEKFHGQRRPPVSEETVKLRKIITQSPAVESIIEQAQRVAPTDSSILILGETGVGKEMFARHIHMKSRRADRPFVVIDPSTMPENLVESILFGHEKGAFTGADRQKKGHLETAHTGTLFIDEIGDIPLPVQVKLLRTLQEKTFTRVGGTQELMSDFRLIAATHRDLKKMVSKGLFREDLLYRINVVPIQIPPLRERKEDIQLLASYFLNRYGAKYHRETIQLSKTNEVVLSAYHWPGNVRELKNVMERTVLLSLEDELEFDLPKSDLPKASGVFEDLPTMAELQKRYILHVLEYTKGKQSGPGGAAQVLGMKRSTLYNRMKKLGISF